MIIYDRDQIKLFFNLLPPLVDDEVYFLSMAARNKYLTPEQRKEYGSLKAEMFSRKLVKNHSFDEYLQVIERYNVITWNHKGNPLPESALIVYANINPSSSLLALTEFYEKSNELLFSIRTDRMVLNRLRSSDTLLMNCFQRSRNRRYYVDIDIDSENRKYALEALKSLIADFQKNEVVFHILETHSGYHILLEKKSIHYDYTKLVKVENTRLGSCNKGEVVVNTNEMVPIPGTLQGGFEVKLLDNIYNL